MVANIFLEKIIKISNTLLAHEINFIPHNPDMLNNKKFRQKFTGIHFLAKTDLHFMNRKICTYLLTASL